MRLKLIQYPSDRAVGQIAIVAGMVAGTDSFDDLNVVCHGGMSGRP